jgi:hypothetical protein
LFCLGQRLVKAEALADDNQAGVECRAEVGDELP